MFANSHADWGRCYGKGVSGDGYGGKMRAVTRPAGQTIVMVYMNSSVPISSEGQCGSLNITIGELRLFSGHFGTCRVLNLPNDWTLAEWLIGAGRRAIFIITTDWAF